MTIYPNDDLFPVYCTNNSRIAALGVVASIAIMALCFFFFDMFVRKEFNNKTDLLEAKRKFVAFVSHEVRTPLNSVCMGPTLMKEEIEAAIGEEHD
mmetsp:Transcript_8117/g.17178  ORF Transcript_8117/g.17178 Transcript_8117/m.17178 type:complete len:96 (-) Transcript_8117:261-548(-)|eukprot:CAMPEP_0168828978 /NCGR_PEP_ID=MMETSP0727-20121128/786_1 /TAXON_ID=265536 /ORGANISM="Amphiprora sp., Strain CCMP467" /LENGTH=95 /DNA_ID=CAMNT_0008882179 /DNA_START=1349 /DNA_END=1636 /DNA_ORIENTATION=-